ncbi:hypothetical protein LTR13_000772 [Exophiala sideris]|nr:hypothetical protein LTR13_000772 [Exophiala sideris]
MSTTKYSLLPTATTATEDASLPSLRQRWTGMVSGLSRPNRFHVKSLIVIIIILSVSFLWAGDVLHLMQGSGRPIPNIVHYTQLLRDPDSNLTLDFEAFMSVYAASFYYKPDHIWIHTDAPESTIEQATSADGEKWTRAVSKIPGVSFMPVATPNYTASSGQKVEIIQHKSDFVRMEVMYNPLRTAGFRNVVGREKYNGINNGVWLSQPGTAMLDIWMLEAPKTYDGAWTSHSVLLLTKIAERLVYTPKEVLIMDVKAFAPTSWEVESVQNLFGAQPHSSADWQGHLALDTDILDAKQRYYHPVETKADWQMDFSSTYAIHAFKNHQSAPIKEITPGDVLSRQSNFARAVYPAARHAFEAGFLTLDDQ